MPTNVPASTTYHVTTGEIVTAIVWLVFYAIILIPPVAAKFAPIGSLIAFYAR